MSSKKSKISSPIDISNENISKELDKFLPIANVSRIMKKSLPQNAKISKEAKETVQECVSEFISFITGEASDKCQREKRKTINGDDLLWAMTTLGFDNYVGPLKGYLNKYREIEGEKSNMGRQEQDSPTNNNYNDHNSSDMFINKGSNIVVPNKLGFDQDFNGGASFYSLCGQKSYENNNNNNNNYMIIGGTNYSVNNNIGVNPEINGGDGTVSRAMASHLQHGIGW